MMRSEKSGKFWNVVLQRDGDQLDRSCENEILHRFEEERNILHTIKRRKANCIGNIWHMNCLLKNVAEWKIEGYKWREDEEDVSSYWMTLKQRGKETLMETEKEAPDRTLRRTHFGRGSRPLVRQLRNEWMNDELQCYSRTLERQ
jgi:hypothetical protein